MYVHVQVCAPVCALVEARAGEPESLPELEAHHIARLTSQSCVTGVHNHARLSRGAGDEDSAPS